MERILRSSAAPISLLTYDSNGVAIDLPSQPTTADVKDSAAVAVTGSPYTVTRTAMGVYQISLSATLATLDTYQVTWNSPDGTKRYTEFEMVGGFFFSIADLLATDSQLANLTGTKARAVRDEVEERFEQRCKVAFVPRGRRYSTGGDGTVSLVVPDVPLRTVVAVTLDGVAFSGSDIAALSVYDWGMVQRTVGLWNRSTPTTPQNISVLYEYGMTEPPGPVKAAALKYAHHRSVASPIDADRMISYSTDIGVVRQEVARGGSTGFPDIDAVLDSFARVAALVR